MKQKLLTANGLNKDVSCVRPATVATAAEYAGSLNTLRQIALDRDLGIPIHLTIDQEGSVSDDLQSGQRLFPHPMGLAAANDPELAYRVALSIGKRS